MLIVLGGLPGVGKTTLARELARQIGAMHLRIDSIEQALRDAGWHAGPMDDAGYRVAYAVAACYCCCDEAIGGGGGGAGAICWNCIPHFFWMLACSIATICPLSCANSAAVGPSPPTKNAAGQKTTIATPVAT